MNDLQYLTVASCDGRWFDRVMDLLLLRNSALDIETQCTYISAYSTIFMWDYQFLHYSWADCTSSVDRRFLVLCTFNRFARRQKKMIVEELHTLESIFIYLKPANIIYFSFYRMPCIKLAAAWIVYSVGCIANVNAKQIYSQLSWNENECKIEAHLKRVRICWDNDRINDEMIIVIFRSRFLLGRCLYFSFRYCFTCTIYCPILEFRECKITE